MMPGLLRATARYDKQVPPYIITVTHSKTLLAELLNTKAIINPATTQKIKKVGINNQSKFMNKVQSGPNVMKLS